MIIAIINTFKVLGISLGITALIVFLIWMAIDGKHLSIRVASGICVALIVFAMTFIQVNGKV